MPRAGLLAQTPANPSFKSVRKFKAHWGVAATAMCYRLHDLGVYSDWQYPTAFVQLMREGYRTDEPDGMENRESSKIMESVLHDIYANHDTPRMTKETGETMRDVSDFAFGLRLNLRNSRDIGVTDGRDDMRHPVSLQLHVNPAFA